MSKRTAAGEHHLLATVYPEQEPFLTTLTPMGQWMDVAEMVRWSDDTEPVDVAVAALGAVLVRIEGDRPEWHRDALCKEYPDVSWFVERGGSTAPAKAVCARCIVREECLASTADDPERPGVWGGTSAGERRRMHLAGEL